jgi:cell wall-associated NlpC family hydrolase
VAGKAGIAAAWALLVAIFVLLLLPLMTAGGAVNSSPVPLCGPGGTRADIAGVQLDAEQMGNAQTVVSVTAARGLPSYAATIALATVAAESMFHNYLVFKDADSLGLFQQRVRYYGAPVATDPALATSAFLERLVAVDHWATRPLTQVAAAVQKPRAGLAGAYSKWQPLATALTGQLWPLAVAAARTEPTLPAGERALPAPAAPTPCPAAGAGRGGLLAEIPSGGSRLIPPGLALTGSVAGNQAVSFALAQLGKPYMWGSNGPHSWDCSSLTQASWASAGVAIARTTFDQVDEGAPVSLFSVRSGDLVFLAGSDGTATSPGHVGMVAGRVGVVLYVISAPHTGEVVQLTPMSQWSQIVSARRIG